MPSKDQLQIQKISKKLIGIFEHPVSVKNLQIIIADDSSELPKEHVPESKARLQDTISSKRVRCERGLNLHLTS